MGRKLILSEPEHKGGDDIYHLLVDTDEGPQVLRFTVSAGMLSVGTGPLTELKLPLPEPDDDVVDAAWDRAVEALPDQVELYNAHYNEKLTPEQIQRLFAGDRDAVRDEVEEDDGYQEALESARWYVVEQYVDEADLDLLKQSGDKVQELFHLIDERDFSDPVGDITRLTGKQFVRYRLGEIELTSMDAEDYNRAASEIVRLLGLDHMFGAIYTILNNADTAWGPRGLWLLFYADVEELIDACQDPDGKHLVVTNPEVLLFDSVNGGGSWAEQIDITVKVPFYPANLQLDAKGVGNGMSWTEEVSAGGATDATVSFETV
jgi:hypothetical protein